MPSGEHLGIQERTHRYFGTHLTSLLSLDRQEPAQVLNNVYHALHKVFLSAHEIIITQTNRIWYMPKARVWKYYISQLFILPFQLDALAIATELTSTKHASGVLPTQRLR